ncbi:MAG: UPF0182 family protein [Actinomycetota bacterium]
MIPERRQGVSKRAIVIVAVIVVLALLFGSARFYTDLLWFREVGFSSVLWTSLRTQFLVGLLVGAFTAAVVWLNLALAARFAPAYGNIRIDITGRRPDGIDQARLTLGPYMAWIRAGISLLIGFLAGLSASSAWQLYLLWANKVDFGVDDPQFGKDLSFYVFELPFLERVAGWVWFAIIASLVVTLALQYFYGAVRPELGWRGVTPSALVHVSVLLGLLALVKAYQYYLGTFQLNFSERGVVTGASYTDVHAHLPALRLLAIISILSAILFLVNIRVRRLALPLAAVGIWILTAFLAGTIWPLVVQRFSVDPQEQQKERPYIERNLNATRTAFGLDDVQSTEFAAEADLAAEELSANQSLLQNIRLWDPAVLQRAYQQLQALRTYYQFTDVDVDRYEVDDEMRQVLLSTRELSLDDIPDRSRTWQNLHLQYTHGFGLVASLANESTTAGAPSFLVRDVPGTVTPGAESFDTDQPRIYYGEGFQANEYSIVNSKQPELDYPLEDAEEDSSVARNSYDGEGGIGVGNLFRRLAFAVREGDPNLVLSSLIDSDSKILIYRNLRDRVRRAAPFLALDNDPYPVVVDGRLTWIMDAYTSTRWYPYAEHFNASDFVSGGQDGALSGTVNYVRNSVKITVDAYDGTMKFYVIDEEDPLISAWRNAFPELFTDEEPSDDLIAHFRYPEDVFSLQSEVYRTYHMTDPQDFYLKEDEWEVPPPTEVQGFETTSEGDFLAPLYLLLKLPGETEEEFVLTRPFTPRNRPTMVSTMIAHSDPDNYGDITLLDFPRVRTVLGPQQVDNLINNDTDIAQILSLLRQQGSSVQFGSLVILPIEDSLLYAQPIFVTAASSSGSSTQGIPELKYVALVLGEEVVMEPKFDSALAALFDLEDPSVTPTPGISPSPGATPSPGPSPTTEPSPAGDRELRALIDRAGRLYNRAQDALADGDFEAYGRLIEQLGRLLSRAEALSN